MQAFANFALGIVFWWTAAQFVPFWLLIAGLAAYGFYLAATDAYDKWAASKLYKQPFQMAPLPDWDDPA